MKSRLLIPSLLVLFLSIALPARADITPKLGTFFGQKTGKVTLYDFIDVGLSGPDSRRKEAKDVLLNNAPAWAAEMRAMAAFAEDTPKDKAIVVHLRSTHAALVALKQDKTKADEAFRALLALRRYAPPKPKVGDGF